MMKKIISCLLTAVFMMNFLVTVKAEEVFTGTLIFASGSCVYFRNGEKCMAESAAYSEDDEVFVPKKSVENYILCDRDISKATLTEKGIDVYESSKYKFLAFGDVSGINAENEEEIIKKFGIYISPDGNDANSGYAAAPVKTFDGARTVYANMRGDNSSFSADIFVHAGIYRFEKSFEPISGMKLKAFGDGEVRLRGSKKISKELFKKTADSELLQKLSEDARAKVYEADLSGLFYSMAKYPEYTALHGGTSYYELFCADKPQVLARFPNYGFINTISASGRNFAAESSRLEIWKNSKYAMAAGYWVHDWAFENIYVDSIDTALGKITLSKDVYGSSIVSGKRYYMMNMPEEIDMPGEYYIDCENKKLYYYPTEDFLSNDPELSVLTTPIFKANGAQNLDISGMTFEYTRGVAIEGQNVKNMRISDCVVRNIGSNGINISGTDCTVEKCEIYSIGAMGVNISGGDRKTLFPGNNTVKNCSIYDFGRIFRTYQSGIMISGVGNRAEYNTVHDAPHSGVRFSGNDNVITRNEIYNVVLECSDSGAIYTGRDWTAWGNEISYNYMHDIKKNPELTNFTVSAVYLDDTETGATVKNNYFENCTQAVLAGGGCGNKIINNTMVECDNGIDYDQRGVTGEWGHSGVIAGGTAYDNAVAFFSDSAIDLQLWKSKYDGLSELLSDIEQYQADSSHETGYPKNAEISGNGFFGTTAENKDYNNISRYVPQYGKVENNTFSKQYTAPEKPECGADKFLWEKKINVKMPRKNAEYKDGNIEFVWDKVSGADSYDVKITDDTGECVFSKTTVQNGCTVRLAQKGTYNWSVSAAAKNEKCEKSGTFTVLKTENTENTFFGGTDFENTNMQELREKYGWAFSAADGDSVSIEEDENGNKYLRMERVEDNLMSGTATYAALSFLKKSTGKISVTFDIMLENYRGGFREMGSVQTKSGSDIMRLLTHEKWVYGMGTQSDKYNFMLFGKPNDKYLTVKRVIDLDNGSYSMQIFCDGNVIASTSEYKCGKGEAEKLIFNLQRQSPYNPCAGTGNAVYRIDNVYVDMGELAPVSVTPSDTQENVSPDSNIVIKWNTPIESDSINADTLKIYKNEALVSDYEVANEGRKTTVRFLNGMGRDAEYRVVLSKNIGVSSLTHIAMTNDYEFSFKTQKSEDFINTAESFERYEAGGLDIGADWTFKVCDGDSISVEKDICGSKALKIVRKESNLLSQNSTWAKLKLKNDGSGNPIMVSYDMRLENYRGGLKNIGTVTSENGIISSLFTHLKWMYGMNTQGGYNVYLSTLPSDEYVTVKRVIDTQKGEYGIWIYKDGKLISHAENQKCGTGNADTIVFEAGYQAPYEIYNGSGDAVMWIDNIRVDSGRMGVYRTIPEDGEDCEKIKSIDAEFNCELDPDTVNYDTVRVYKYSSGLSEEQYKISVYGNIIRIGLTDAIENGEECQIVLSGGIKAKNRELIEPMSEDYIIELKTQSSIYDKTLAQYSFDDWDGFSYDGPAKITHDGWTFELQEGDSVSVEMNEKTGTKALKLVKGSNRPSMKAYFDYSISDKQNKVDISFNTCFDRQSRKVEHWGSAVNSSGRDFMKLLCYGNGYWHNRIGDTKRYICSIGENVKTIKESLYPTDKTYTVAAYADSKLQSEKSEGASSGIVPERVLFSVSNVRDMYSGEDSGDGIYWIDNVSVKEVFAPKLQNIESDYLNGAELILDRSIDPESVNKDTVKIYDNGVRMTQYALRLNGTKKVAADFKMKAGHNYIFELNGILSVNGVKMQKQTVNLVCEQIFEVDGELNIVTNLEYYTVISVEKDENGNISDITKYEKGTEPGVPKKNTVYYFWDSLQGMKPIHEILFF